MDASNSNIIIKEASPEEIFRVQEEHFQRLFANRNIIDELKPPNPNVDPRELRFVVLRDGKAIGWHVGHAINSTTYYMKNSAIVEKHQNRGLYTRLLNVVLEKIRTEGYEIVTSLHHPNNAAVLIPKLRQGFIITGVSFHERFRFVVELKYFFNLQQRRQYETALGLALT